MVKTVRKKPFGEWNVVYYDASKTTPEKILKRLRAKGCPKARRIPDSKAKARGAIVSVKNPYVAPGDCVLLTLGGDVDGKPEITVPKGWTLLPGPTQKKDKVSWFYVQTAKKTKQGKHAIQLTLPDEDGERKLSLQVDVVALIK